MPSLRKHSSASRLRSARVPTGREDIFALLAQLREARIVQSLEWLERCETQLLDHLDTFSRKDQFLVLRACASGCQAAGRWLDGLSYAQEALERLNDREEREQIPFLAITGNLYRRLGNPQLAVLSYERAITIARRHAMLTDMARLLLSVGNVYSDIQWPERALDCFSECCSLCEAHGFTTIHPQALNNLANHHLRLGETARAFAYVEQTLALISGQAGMSYALPYAEHTLADCLSQQQRYDEALVALDRSEAALAEQPNLPLQLRIWLDRARLLLLADKPLQALEGLTRTLELAREHDLHRLRAEACLLTARSHRRLGHIEDGLAALDDYVAAQADACHLEQEAHRLAIAFLQQTEHSLEEAQRHARQVEALTLRLIDSQVQASQLTARAATDPLTEAHNRQALLERLDELCRQEGPQPFSVLLIDCDDLKSINSELGTETGDQALRHIAQTVSRILRISDIFGRYGGDEFLVIAPNAGPASAASVAERIISTLDALPLSVKNRSIRITVSIGAACVPGSARLLPETCLRRAERSLSRARAQGSGRYAIARINLERPEEE